MNTNWHEAAEAVASGQLAVIPTDTIYGLVAAAADPEAICKLDAVKDRPTDNPYIVLIADLADLAFFDVKIDEPTTSFLRQVWPGPVSVILPCPAPKFHYLHRGRNLAFRLPADPNLRKFLADTGPVAAPSANKSGLAPAATIAEAHAYFGEAVAAYVAAPVEPYANSPSAVIDITGPKPIIVRPGSTDLLDVISSFTDRPSLSMMKVMDENKDYVTYDDFAKLDLRAARVEKAERVEGSDKLLQLEVTLGEERRQIIAGIGKSYTPEEIIGQQIIIIANLEPRKLMGLESQGMLLAASGETGPVILSPATEVPSGSIIK